MSILREARRTPHACRFALFYRRTDEIQLASCPPGTSLYHMAWAYSLDLCTCAADAPAVEFANHLPPIVYETSFVRVGSLPRSANISDSLHDKLQIRMARVVRARTTALVNTEGGPLRPWLANAFYVVYIDSMFRGGVGRTGVNRCPIYPLQSRLYAYIPVEMQQRCLEPKRWYPVVSVRLIYAGGGRLTLLHASSCAHAHGAGRSVTEACDHFFLVYVWTASQTHTGGYSRISVIDVSPQR